MRITIIAVGSRGDTQPYIALGRGLERAGHSVTVAAHEIFRDLVGAHGLAFDPIAGDPRAVLADPASGRWLASGRRRDMLRAGRSFLRSFPPVFDALLADYVRVTQQSDMLIYSVVAAPAASVAEQRGIPAVAAMLQPLHPTRAFPTIGLPSQPRLGAGLNLATHYAASWMLSLPTRRAINAWRQRTLGLPPLSANPAGSWPIANVSSERATAIYGYSPRVVPRPADWAATVHVTGYWVLDAPSAWRPASELESFLAAGPPPVYIGFGSMTPLSSEHARRLTHVAFDALERTGQRGVLLRGWGALGEHAECAQERPIHCRRQCSARVAVPADGGDRASRRKRNNRSRSSRRRPLNRDPSGFRSRILGGARAGARRRTRIECIDGT